MDWWAIISNALRAGIGTTAIIYCPRRDRPEPALRLHRPAQLRPGRVHGRRRLRRRHHDRHYGWPLWWASSSAWRAGVVLALLLGAPTLRLRADYLAIVTIAAGEIIRIIVSPADLSDVDSAAPTASTASPRVPGQWNFIWNPCTRYGGRCSAAQLRFTGADLWEMLIGWTPRRRCCRARHVARSCRARGAGCSLDPRGRGRRPVARQERLPVQDAVADPRRLVRHARRDVLRPRQQTRCSPTTTRRR